MNKSKIRYILFTLFLFVSSGVCFYRPSIIYATSSIFFEDDFNGNSLDSGKWVDNSMAGEVNVGSGYLKLSSSSPNYFPIITSNTKIIPDSGNYSIEISFTYPSSTHWGTGIFLGNVIPKYNDSASDSDLYHFLIWNDIDSQFYIQTHNCLNDLTCDPSRTMLYRSTEEYKPHLFKLDYVNDYFKLTVDNIEVNNPALLSTSRRPKYLSFGDIYRMNNVSWTPLWIDYVRTYKHEDPILINRLPIIIIPGLGASWDFQALLSGQSGKNWKVPGFVKLYSNLTDSLVNSGYEIDKNLFVFGYDWRKRLTDLSVDLKSYIDGLVSAGKIESTDKVILIGHSYGGLVARSFALDGNKDRVEKIITVGSPHEGIVDSYGFWEGATVWKNVWWQRAAVELQTRLNQKVGEAKVDTIRRLAPGIQDTLPIFDFLRGSTGMISHDSMSQKNAFLETQSSTISNLNSILTSNAGTGESTYSLVNVSGRNWRDKAMGLWEDGKPSSDSPFEDTNDGDGAVLISSAHSNFSNINTIAGTHEEIINNEDGIKKIFNELGMDENKVIANESVDNRKKVFVAALRSPGIMHVCNLEEMCDEDLGIYDTVNKLFFLPDYDDKNLKIRIEASGSSGTYHLYTGDLDEGTADWDVIEGKLAKPDQIDNYVFDGINNVINGDVDSLRRVVKLDIEKLRQLKVRIDYEEHEDDEDFREELAEAAVRANKNKNFEQLEQILITWSDYDNLTKLSTRDSRRKSNSVLATIKMLEGYRFIAERILARGASLYAAKFYDLFEETFDYAKSVSNTNRELAFRLTNSAKLLLSTAVSIR